MPSAFHISNVTNHGLNKRRYQIQRFSPTHPRRRFRRVMEEHGLREQVKSGPRRIPRFHNRSQWTREEGEEIAGTITLLYYLDKPGLLNHIVEAQHKFGNVVLSSMHLHLTENKCMEIIAVKGKATDVKSLSQELMTKKGVKQLKFTVMAP